MRTPAIILAAGASRRLGQPKQLACVAGEALLARTIRVVFESGADPIFVVLGAHRESIEATVDLSDVQSVVNSNWEQGIASSIHAGIAALQQRDPTASAALLLVCDQPRLSADHLRRLVTAYEDSRQPSIAASEYAGIIGIPAIFPASQFAELLLLEGDSGARTLLRNSACAVTAIQFDGGEMDVDTPSDLAASCATIPS